MTRSKRYIALFVSLFALATITAMPASAIEYWDGGKTFVQVRCMVGVGNGFGVAATSQTSVTTGTPHYAVQIYDGARLLVNGNWIRSGQQATLFSSTRIQYKATHYFVWHARYTGTGPYSGWVYTREGPFNDFVDGWYGSPSYGAPCYL